MPGYRVNWQFEATTDDPIQAAFLARDEMRNPDSIATVMTVVEEGSGKTMLLDVALEDEALIISSEFDEHDIG